MKAILSNTDSSVCGSRWSGGENWPKILTDGDKATLGNQYPTKTNIVARNSLFQKGVALLCQRLLIWSLERVAISLNSRQLSHGYRLPYSRRSKMPSTNLMSGCECGFEDLLVAAASLILVSLRVKERSFVDVMHLIVQVFKPKHRLITFLYYRLSCCQSRTRIHTINHINHLLSCTRAQADIMVSPFGFLPALAATLLTITIIKWVM